VSAITDLLDAGQSHLDDHAVRLVPEHGGEALAHASVLPTSVVDQRPALGDVEHLAEQAEQAPGLEPLVASAVSASGSVGIGLVVHGTRRANGTK